MIVTPGSSNKTRHRPCSFIALMPRLTESKKKKAKAG